LQCVITTPSNTGNKKGFILYKKVTYRTFKYVNLVMSFEG